MDSKERIRGYILEHVDDSGLRDDEDIFETRRVSSMFVMQLVLFVEQEFGIAVGGEDLSFDHFRSVEALDGLVSRKLAAA